VTNGEISGTSGADRRAFVAGAGATAAIVLGVTLINVATIRHDMPHLDWQEPWIWEGSSALSILALLWIPWLAQRLAPLEEWRSPRAWAIHVAALLVWSAAHVAGFLLLRHGAYALVGEAYRYGDLRTEFPYELRKDLLSYTLTSCAFWVARRLALQSSAAKPDQPATFDIRDGARVIRVAVTDILAVASAGNYVEVHLADGRKPLMRSSLAAVEGRLSPFGFIRTHRSWLVSAARVTGLTPAGSGDYTVTLGSLEAPLSRRFPAALMRLRGG
jgi:DNA-binding LytR/AlgR family response regulator